MKSFVVDASAAIKWFFHEVHSETALRLLGRQREGSVALHVPDLFFCETANILWKKIQRGELDEPAGQKIVVALSRVAKTVYPAEALLPLALALACRSGRTVYDSLYLVLAASLECEMITADRRLYNSLANTAWARWVRWIEDI